MKVIKMEFKTRNRYKLLILLKATQDYKKVLIETTKTIDTSPFNIGAITLLNGKINLCKNIIHSINKELEKEIEKGDV